MQSDLNSAQGHARYIIKKADQLDLFESREALTNLKKELKKLKAAFVEELTYIKAQTVSKKNGNSVMKEAKKRLSKLKESMRLS